MKKLIFLMILIFASDLYAQENKEYPLVKLAEFNNSKEAGCLFIRKDNEVAPSDDLTGNIMRISNKGEIFIHCYDKDEINLYDEINKRIKYEHDSKFLESFDCEHFQSVTDKNFLFIGSSGRFKMLDRNFNMKYKIYLSDLDYNVYVREAYYDEQSDILFFRDNNEKLYSIVHPGLDNEQNRKNFKTPEETLEMIRSKVYAPHLTISPYNGLLIDGNYYYWGQQRIGNFVYQLNRKDCFLYDIRNTSKYFNIYYDDYENVESVAIHPSGDIYVLRMNWETNRHTLYRIENTWDSAWRKQWYKKHK